MKIQMVMSCLNVHIFAKEIEFNNVFTKDGKIGNLKGNLHFIIGIALHKF